MKKEVIVCDGCKKFLEKTKEIYYLDLRTDKFWTGVDIDYLTKSLQFCEKCAAEIKQALIRIEQELKRGEKR